MNVAPTIANRPVSPVAGRPGHGPGINHHPAYGPGTDLDGTSRTRCA